MAGLGPPPHHHHHHQQQQQQQHSREHHHHQPGSSSTTLANDSLNASSPTPAAVTIQSTSGGGVGGVGPSPASRSFKQRSSSRQVQVQDHRSTEATGHQHHGQLVTHTSSSGASTITTTGAAEGRRGAPYDYDLTTPPHVHYQRAPPPPSQASSSAASHHRERDRDRDRGDRIDRGERDRDRDRDRGEIRDRDSLPLSPPPPGQHSSGQSSQHSDRHYLPPPHSPPQQPYASGPSSSSTALVHHRSHHHPHHQHHHHPPQQSSSSINFQHYHRSNTSTAPGAGAGAGSSGSSVSVVNSIGGGRQAHSSYHLHQPPVSLLNAPTATSSPADIAADPKRIVGEFCQLLEKSKQLFNGLRDLPQYGNKHWQVYFGRTFDIYTRLWRFQQQHRHILDNQFGLKRWQIGEIASKIGQLYYHYYLRTSDTGFLLEAFSFYAAIRSRQYYSKATREEKPELMVKKLRYYARFILVCLLLKKLKLVRDLIRELSRQIDEYVNAYDPEDQLEWSLVLTEIKSFVEADNIVNIVDVDSSTVILSHRLTPYNTPPLERGIPANLALQEALIVGNTYDQVKFSDVTLDMFWMIQALEREPHEDLLNSSGRAADSSPAPGKTPYDEPSQSTKQNPHKYLLYKPTFTQFCLFVSSALKELPNNGAILLYISADGAFEPFKRSQTPHHAYDLGGLATNNRRENGSGVPAIENTKSKSANQNVRDIHCVYPGDLYPILRRPLFCIVDSDNSSVFMGMPKLFGQPLIVLTSPVDVPPFLHEQPQRGSLFTLFLHSPLTAFCYVCNIGVVPIAVWDKCQAHIDKFICEAGRLLVRTSGVDHSYVDFYGDDFLRLILLRFIFCQCVLRLHRSFRGNPVFHPHCHPSLPEAELLQHPNLIRLVLDLACILDVMSAFRDSEETVC